MKNNKLDLELDYKGANIFDLFEVYLRKKYDLRPSPDGRTKNFSDFNTWLGTFLN